MKGLYDKIQEAVDYIQNKTSTTPRFALVLGTGLGGMAGSIDAEATFSYGEIPHCVTATGLGHAGNLIVGSLGGKDVVAMQGRLHYYEGYSMQEITFPVRVMRALGAGEVVMSSAVGGMNPHLDRGDIVVLTDHMNLMGDNPLIGWNDDRLGERFPDMSEPYSQERRRFFEKIASDDGVTVRRAVLAAVAGPNLETAAEYRFLRRIGADVVGMSTVPETIVAIHARRLRLRLHPGRTHCAAGPGLRGWRRLRLQGLLCRQLRHLPRRPVRGERLPGGRQRLDL